MFCVEPVARVILEDSIRWDIRPKVSVTLFCLTFAFGRIPEIIGLILMNGKGKKTNQSLKVVNDVAERVKLMEELTDVLTDNEEDRKLILHCVEITSKLYPDFRKSSLPKSN